jgi:hypothetical protein
MALCAAAAADSRCNCSTKLGKCDARVKLEGNRLLVSSSAPQCSMVILLIDGQPRVSNVTDGISSEEWLGPTANPRLEVDSCTVCADRNYPVAATPPPAARGSAFVGTWAVTGQCSWGSNSYTFRITEVSATGSVSASGDFGRCSFDSGRVDGSSITMDCSNWLNRVRYAGSLVSPTQISGTYTQSTSSETCTWSARKQ